MISKGQLERALYRIGYHFTTSVDKVSLFIERCQIEVDGAGKFSVAVIKDVAYSMLDADLERELFEVLNI